MINYLYILPEIIVASALSFIIIIDLFLSKKFKNLSYYLIQLLLFSTIYIIYSDIDFLSSNSSNLYDTGFFSNFFKIFIFVSLSIILQYTYQFLNKFDLYKTEYFVISIFGTLGMMIMISANHLLLLYLGIELLSLSLYSVIAFNKKSIYSSEAAVKYYILGAMSSGFLLFGISLIYGLTGSLFYHEISQQISLLNLSNIDDDIRVLGLIFSLTFIFISLAFKFGAAPFHMWIPDVYHGSLITTTLLLSSVPKIAVFIILIKLLGLVFSGLEVFWSDIMKILAVLSIIIGNITAIAQTNIKRMLAYSTIANIGFILLALSIGSYESFIAAMFYTVTYVITTILAFGLLSQLLSDNNGIEEIKDISGLAKYNPLAAFMLLVLMLSYIGIPPFLGFHAKLFVIQSLVQSNNVVLGIFAVIMTVIGSYYYLRVVKVIYFDEYNGSLSFSSNHMLSAILIFILIYLGLFPSHLGEISVYSITNLFNT
ncbi:MAG: NADH-quinone oxidoreductase subunit N [Pseudomonadota bacterium]|nr:NADH-quinone oxidoreductase subunit N [Pseudomonadota bacterium]